MVKVQSYIVRLWSGAWAASSAPTLFCEIVVTKDPGQALKYPTPAAAYVEFPGATLDAISIEVAHHEAE